MAWIDRLSATYDACANHIEKVGAKLWPAGHLVKNAHIEVAIDPSGELKRARVLTHEEAPTLIPATEDSAGRTSGEEPHPLCEELSYCAADIPGGKRSRFNAYKELLEQWCTSDASHPKAQAVLSCISKENLWSELNKKGIFPVVVLDAKRAKSKIADEKAFIRWVVEFMDSPDSTTWDDPSLIEAWQQFDSAQSNQSGLCMVAGNETRLTLNHPRFVRYPGDGGKIISFNDFSGFTFLGRFTDQKKDFEKKARRKTFKPLQACSVSFDASQKAHATLRWLIRRQGYRNGEQIFVAWAIAGKVIPDPWGDSLSVILSGESLLPPKTVEAPALLGDVGQSFALHLRRAIAGYGSKLEPSDEIVVMGLDSATPGRMSIIYYRELKGEEFLERIESWHAAYAWPQNFGKDKHFTGAPAPHDIAEAVYATRLGTAGALRLDEKLKKATVERLLPCIVDSQPLPRDLVMSAVRRASQRSAMQKVKYGGKVFEEEWEKVLGIACGLFRGWSKLQGKEYQMALEEDRTSRDYLYGRLLAVADNLEGYALYQAKETRETSAARLMQRFADHPFSTWRTIELSLPPYKARLRASAKGGFVLLKCEKLFDTIQGLFASSDFTDDRPLSGEFLLGYHCQRAALIPGSNSQNPDQNTSEDN